MRAELCILFLSYLKSKIFPPEWAIDWLLFHTELMDAVSSHNEFLKNWLSITCSSGTALATAKYLIFPRKPVTNGIVLADNCSALDKKHLSYRYLMSCKNSLFPYILSLGSSKIVKVNNLAIYFIQVDSLAIACFSRAIFYNSQKFSQILASF